MIPARVQRAAAMMHAALVDNGYRLHDAKFRGYVGLPPDGLTYSHMQRPSGALVTPDGDAVACVLYVEDGDRRRPACAFNHPRALTDHLERIRP